MRTHDVIIIYKASLVKKVIMLRSAFLSPFHSLFNKRRTKFVLILLMNLVALKGVVMNNKFPRINKNGDIF